MPTKKLKEFLDSHQVNYLLVAHSPAFTSQEIAATAHISGKQFAKIVIVKLDNKLAMVVLPANHKISFSKLRTETGAGKVDLSSELEFKEKFPECEVGAMPPFGNLYDMPVYVANDLSKQKQIAFNAGSHSELMQVQFDDLNRLVKPKIVSI